MSMPSENPSAADNQQVTAQEILDDFAALEEAIADLPGGMELLFKEVRWNRYKEMVQRLLNGEQDLQLLSNALQESRLLLQYTRERILKIWKENPVAGSSETTRNAPSREG